MPAGETRSRTIPDPDEGDLEAWAEQVGVDAIAPWRDAGDIHVFHLLQDRPTETAELMRYELGRLGELETFLNSAQANQLVSPPERERLTRRARAARMILDDWRLRHDRPVDNRALAESGAISDHFMERVQDLNKTLGGRPKALIDGLREGQVSRFRSDNIDQLEHWLMDQGYLNAQREREPLGSARISLKSGLPPEQVSELRDWIIGAINNPLEG
jgi:hypothetical protein